MDKHASVVADRGPIFIGLAGRDLARFGSGFVEREIPDVIVRHAGVADEINASIFCIPTECVNPGTETEYFLRCTSFGRHLPKVCLWPVHATLFVRQILMGRKTYPLPV